MILKKIYIYFKIDSQLFYLFIYRILLKHANSCEIIKVRDLKNYMVFVFWLNRKS